MFVPSPIERTHQGDYRLRLSDGERELLERLPAELLALLAAEPDDPALRRLRPPPTRTTPRRRTNTGG